MLGSKISNALENNNSAASSMHLKLRRDLSKKDDVKVGESQLGVGLEANYDYVLSHFRRRLERGYCKGVLT